MKAAILNAHVKKSIITIAGSIGSGKSSTARALANALGYQHFSSGDLMRAIAMERNLSIEAINAFPVDERRDIDEHIDNMLRDLGEGEHLVIDSRMAFRWIPDSFKLFLHVDPETAAERIFAQITNDGRVGQSGSSIEEIRAATETRTEQETARYRTLYGVDIYNESQFDLVIDTVGDDLSTVAATALAAYQTWHEG